MTTEDENARPSKSARKREIKALQELAVELATLSDRQLERLGVNAQLRDALTVLRGMQSSGERNRQIKYCVRFMDDEELADAKAFLDDRGSRKVAVNQAFHALERLRDRLIEHGDDALSGLFAKDPELDRQRIRQLVREARRERDTGKPAGAGKKLFRFLRESGFHE